MTRRSHLIAAGIVLVTLGSAGCDSERGGPNPPGAGAAGTGGTPSLATGGAGGVGGSATLPDGTGGAPSGTGGTTALGEIWLMLNDFEGGAGNWLFAMRSDGVTSRDLPSAATTPARDASPSALHFNGEVPASGIDFFTHHHVDLRQLFSGVRFWTRRGTTGPADLLVALTGLAEVSSTYEADRAAGKPWRVRRVPLTEDWQHVTVNWSDLAPEVSGDVVPTWSGMGSALHFIIESGQNADVWLDDIEAACAAASCASTGNPPASAPPG